MKQLLYNLLFSRKERAIIEMALYNLANTDAYINKYLHKKDKDNGLEAERLAKKIQKGWQ